jgi:hypothetical protein
VMIALGLLAIAGKMRVGPSTMAMHAEHATVAAHDGR